MGTSVVVRRVNAIHCGLPASLCVHIYPSGSVRVGKYIRFIGERNRAARKGHTLPTLQWYLKPLFPKASFAFCCCAFRYRSILFSLSFFFSYTREKKKLVKWIYENFIRKLRCNRFLLFFSRTVKLILLWFLYTSWKFPSPVTVDDIFF